MTEHNNKNCKIGAQILLPLSFVALALATVVSLFEVDLWLAGTQWILVAMLLAIYALIFGGHSSSCGSEKE